MKKIELGQTIQIIANVGVIAGIIFLAVQINQSNTLARAQMRNDVAQSIADALFANSSEEVTELEVKVRDAPEELSSSESLQYYRIVNSMFRRFENTHYQYRIGLFDDSEFEAERAAWEGYSRRPQVLQIWCGNREVFAADFRAEFDALLEPPGCPADQP